MMVENSSRGAYRAKMTTDTNVLEDKVDKEQALPRNDTSPSSPSSHSKSTIEAPPDEEMDDQVSIRLSAEKLREAERIIASEVVFRNEVPDTLLNWSATAGTFQISQTLIMFILAAFRSTNQWYCSVSYPDENDAGELIPDIQEVGSFRVLWLIPFITLLSGIQHASCVIFQETYEWYVSRHQNPFRWTEYTFSAPLARMVVAIQVGVTDAHLLMCIFMLAAICIQCGAAHESSNAKARSENRPQNWRTFFTALLCHATSWAIIFNYCAALNRTTDASIHTWLVTIILFLLDSSFAVVFVLQWKKIGIFEDYIKGEKAFLILSFTAKTLIAWLSLTNVIVQSE